MQRVNLFMKNFSIGQQRKETFGNRRNLSKEKRPDSRTRNGPDTRPTSSQSPSTPYCHFSRTGTNRPTSRLQSRVSDMLGRVNRDGTNNDGNRRPLSPKLVHNQSRLDTSNSNKPRETHHPTRGYPTNKDPHLNYPPN